jgi:hypothetical protein
VIDEKDLGDLRAYPPRVIEYIVEPPCHRLKHYWQIAVSFRDHCRAIDRLRSTDVTAGLADSLIFRENHIAFCIPFIDPDLRGMVEGAHLTSEFDRICHIYARIVLGHEDDPDCSKIVAALLKLGFKVSDPSACK